MGLSPLQVQVGNTGRASFPMNSLDPVSNHIFLSLLSASTGTWAELELVHEANRQVRSSFEP